MTDYTCELDLSQLSPEEDAWYKEFQEKIGLGDLTEALAYHSSMYHARARVRRGTSREEVIRSFLEQPGPQGLEEEQFSVLGIVLEKVIDGEDLPDF